MWVSTKCGYSDTTTGLASCPTVGNMYDKLIPHGITGVFGETSEITGGEHLARARAATPEIGEIGGTRGPCARDALHRVGAAVIHDAMMAGARQPQADIATHSTKADDA